MWLKGIIGVCRMTKRLNCTNLYLRLRIHVQTINCWNTFWTVHGTVIIAEILRSKLQLAKMMCDQWHFKFSHGPKGHDVFAYILFWSTYIFCVHSKLSICSILRNGRCYSRQQRDRFVNQIWIYVHVGQTWEKEERIFRGLQVWWKRTGVAWDLL